MSDTKFDDHLFDNNPFRDTLRGLKKGGLPARAGQDPRFAQSARRRRHKRHGDPDLEDEQRLFLQAMEGMGAPAEDGNTTGFFLGEVDNFPVSGPDRGKSGPKAGSNLGGARDLKAARVRSGHAQPSGAGQSHGCGQKSAAQDKGLAAPVMAASQGGAPNRASCCGESGRGTGAGQQGAAAQDEGEAREFAQAMRGEEPLDDFTRAMQGVIPLHKSGRDVTPAAPATKTPLPAGNALQDLLEGKLEFELCFTEEYMEGHVMGLDPIMMGKLRQGAISAESHIDLHGMNSLQAFETLRGFIKGAWFKGMRCLLVVCGRGKNSPNGVGVLREKLKLWFTQDPFKRVILAFCTAKPHDGGPGSVYVLLRQYKKKGRVAWERMPADEDLL